MSDASYSVSYSRDSRDDLEAIAMHISRSAGFPKAARRQVTRIRDAVRSLESMPMRHPLVDDELLAGQGLCRMNVGGYAIFYVVDEEARDVFVVRIMGGKRNLRSVFGLS